MRPGARQVLATPLLVLLLVLSGPILEPSSRAADAVLTERISLQEQSPAAGDASRLETFSVDPRDTPVEVGDSVPVHAVLVPGPGTGEARLHVTVEQARAPHRTVAELEAPPRPVKALQSQLLAEFWEPTTPGRYVLGGHVHAGENRLEMPSRAATVHPAASDELPPREGSAIQVGIAPGTVLWALTFMGLAYASQAHKHRER